MGLLSKDDLDYYLSQLGAYFAIMLRDNPDDTYKELYSHYDAVREHIQTLEKTNGWISVNDRLPEKAGTYIICDHYGNVMSRHFCKSYGRFSGYWHFNGSAKYGNPRYWKPMPEGPEMEGT